MSIGSRVKFLREAAGLSQTELARQIGIKPPSLWQIESGDTKTIRAQTLMRLAAVFNAAPEWISTGNGAPYKMAVSGPEEAELVSIYRNLPTAAQLALLGAAKGMLDAQPRASHLDPFKTARRK